jgi:uncharacterized protein (AIM24 family)
MPLEIENPKVVKTAIVPGQQVYARKGSMLYYQGNITFTPHSMSGGGMPGMGAIAGAAGRMMQGEHVPLIVGEGQGTAYFGHKGLYTDVVQLDGAAPLMVEASRLLAYEGYIQSSIVPMTNQGGMKGAMRGMVTGQGMFTTQLSGQGAAAILSHGGTFQIEIGPGRPEVVVDPQSYVGHRGHIQVDLSAKVGFRDVTGRGSGEAMQLKLSGQGTVWVQASEQKF